MIELKECGVEPDGPDGPLTKSWIDFIHNVSTDGQIDDAIHVRQEAYGKDDRWARVLELEQCIRFIVRP